MSVKITKATGFHDTPQEVKYKINKVEMRELRNKQSAYFICGIRAQVGNTEGELESSEVILSVDNILDTFSTYEKTALKAVIKAFEREAAKQLPELANETQDESDVFA